jgi:hypothetical protein
VLQRRPERAFLLERRQDFRGRGQCPRVVRVVATERTGHGVREFERFFASEVPHQKVILPIRRSSGPGLELGDQFLRALLLAVHGYPFEPMARLNV